MDIWVLTSTMPPFYRSGNGRTELIRIAPEPSAVADRFRREAVTAVAEFQPGASAGRHTHPGDEVGYILEGTVVIAQDGKPAVTLGPGKAFHIPAVTIHNATNSGTGTARVLATYIVEKGKPLASPAPAK